MNAVTERLELIRSSPRGKNIGAFFDYDGTLIEGFSASAIVGARIRSMEFDLREAFCAISIGLLGVKSEQDFAEVLDVTRPTFEGKTYAELLEFGENLFRNDTSAKLRPQIWQLIRAHRARGHRIVIASSATVFQIEPIARAIDADHALATDVEVVDGLVTGDVKGRPLWGPGKAAAVRALAAEHDLDLEASFAYSDGNEDVPFLEAVGHPAAVSPRHFLRAEAETRGWPIIDIRNPSSNRFAMAARTWAYYSSFLSSAALGLTGGALSGSPAAIVRTLSVGNDLGLTLAGVDIKVIGGAQHLTDGRPCVFVFNHQSKLDLAVLIHLIRGDATGVMKKEIAKVPVLGPILASTGAVFIDRADSTRARDQLEPAVRKLHDEGVSLVIAPEGTRSSTPRVAEFKKGAFHIAMQAQVPVVPIVLRNVGELMWRGAKLIKPGSVDVWVLPPVDTSTWRPETVGEHAEEVRQMFIRALADWPVGAFDEPSESGMAFDE